LLLALWVIGTGNRPGTASLDGAALYATYCAACHGANLEGQPEWRKRRPDGRLPAPPHDATGHTWHHSEQQLFDITKHGLLPPNAPPDYATDMPAFKGTLSDAEIRAVLAWIAAQWTEEVHKMRQERFGKG
jgi:mono/diheme cytochrome c family protein